MSTYSFNHGNHAAAKELKMTLSHSAAFHKQAAFNHDSKIKVGKNVWREGQAGYRLYELVLSKQPATIAKAFILASELKQPFTPGQVMGHLRWLYSGGQLEVDGTSYVVQAKPKVEKVKVAKPEPKAKAEPVKTPAKTSVKAKVPAPTPSKKERTKKAA
jgi:hypothetical protein